MMDQAMRTLGFAGRTPESLNQDEKNNLQMFLRTSAQNQRQSGMGTPRMVSGGNSMIPGGSQPGPSGPQGGMPGSNFPQQFPQSQQMMGQHPQQMKRPGSPSMQMDTPTNESSPPERKRLRKDSQNGSTPSMPGYAPGGPGANGQQQQPMPNGAGHPNMMRPPPGAQTMNPMMINGGPHGPGANPMQGPQQQGPQRFTMLMQNKAGGLVANPHGPGLSIPVKNEPGYMDPQQQAGNLDPRGPQPKAQPSPFIPNAKASGSMPPPSHTPNPSQAANKPGIKEEPSMDGTAESSPGTRAATQNPPTPVPNPATPATAQNPNLGTNIFNSTIAPSPSAILSQVNNMNQSTPPNNAATTNASAFNLLGADLYPGSYFSMLDQYGFGGGLSMQDGPSVTDDSCFDLLAEFLDPNADGPSAAVLTEVLDPSGSDCNPR